MMNMQRQMNSQMYPNNFEDYLKSEIYELIDEYCGKIDFADSICVIDYFVEEYKYCVDLLIGGNDDPEQSLENKKKEARDYINDYLSSYNGVYWVFKSEIDEFIDEIYKRLDQAGSEEDVDLCIRQFEERMSQYPSNIDVYLAELRYSLRESLIDYIGITQIELNAYMSEDEIDDLIEDFDRKIRDSNQYEIIMYEYNNFINYVYNHLISLSETNKLPFEPKTNKSNAGLIVACSIEGVVIIAGAVLGILFLLRKKKVAY